MNEKKDEVESFDVYGENEGESASECSSTFARFMVLAILMLVCTQSNTALWSGGRLPR